MSPRESDRPPDGARESSASDETVDSGPPPSNEEEIPTLEASVTPPLGLDPTGELEHLGASLDPPLGRGDAIGRYVILDQLGGGGMGLVYRAYDPELDRRVALKLLRVRAGTTAAREQASARLLREAQAAARLSHPNVVAVHDAGRHGDRVFLAMELVKGGTLREWRTREQRSWREVLSMYLAAGRGLAAAHEVGLVHRDFKPENVLVGEDGRPRVADFGLARPAQRSRPSPKTPTATSLPAFGPRENLLSTPLTMTGTLVGTPAYMSPEQHEGRSPDARSDQFSFCMALYEGLYGERPFAANNVADLAAEVARGDVREPPAGSKVPTWLREVLLRGLSADRNARFPSMHALLEELARDPAARRRRWAIGAATVAALGAAAAISWSLASSPSSICAGAPERAAAVWNQTRSRAIHAAFLRSGKPYAEDAWRGVQRELDRYTRAWTEMYTDACEATRVRGEQSEALLDRRMICLDDRLGRLGAVLSALQGGAQRVVARAVSAVSRLPPLYECADKRSLATEVRPPRDPRTRKRIDALRTRLHRAWATYERGRYAEVVAQTSRIARETEKLGYRPLEARAWFLHGFTLEELGRYREAAQSLRRAVWAAKAGRAARMEAQAASLLVWVVGRQRGRHQEGERWGRFAQAAIEPLPRNARLRATLATHLGSLARVRGQLDRAVALHRQAVGLKAWGPHQLETATNINNLAIALGERGKSAEALALHRQALKIRTEAVGSHHPLVGQSLLNIGIVLYDLGRFTQAGAAFERALRIYERALPPGHVRIGRVLNNLAAVLYQQGKLAEAERRYRRLLALRVKRYGPNHLRVGTVHQNLGNVLLARKRPRQARPHFEQAVRVRERELGRDHPSTARALDSLATCLREMGHPTQALPLHRRAAAIFEKKLGPQHREVALTLRARAATLRALKRYDDAVRMLRRSAAIFTRKQGERSPELARTLTDLGETLIAAAKARAALAPLERAVAILGKQSPDPEDLATARFQLARALRAGGGDGRRAERLAEKALTTLRQLGARGRRRYLDVRRWLARTGQR